MEITPLNNSINEVLQQQRLQRSEDEVSVNALSISREEVNNERVKGSYSLQKELLSIVSANSEAQAQKDAQRQLEKGYLDLKV
jgi:hypothetical protein